MGAGHLESVICPGTHNVSPPGPVPAASPVAGTGHSLLLKWLACFKAWNFSYGKLLLFSICNKLFLPNLSNLGSTNSPDIIIKVKNILKCQLHDFSRGMSSNRAKMLLLYGKYLLCLTGTSWSSSVLRGRMGPRAVFSVEFSPRFGANLCSFTPAAGPVLWQKGSWQQGCPMECCPLWFITQGTATCFLREKWKGI